MSTDSLQEDSVQKRDAPEGVAQNQVVEDSAADVQALPSSPMSTWQQWLGGAIALLTVIVLVFWGIHTSQTTDPYVQGVLQISGNPARGKDIFTLNCATCHGLEAAGEVGPDLNGVSERKSKVALIHQVISGQTPPMPQFQPSEKDMADLLSFLETL